jgi:phosphatidylinositol-3-phosphatase
MNTKKILLAATAAAFCTSAAVANELEFPGHFGKLDHVFVIMMENQTDTDILGSANAPFINSYVKVANQATNYFAVGHPSAPNYLEIVGGSNFGLTDDFWPVWINGGCVDNGGGGCANAFPPIAAPGTDNAVVATATTSSQCNGQLTVTTPVPNNCALYNYPAAYFTPKSIADQLVATGRSWKTYQESLPTVVPGVAGVNYADGAYSNLSPASVFANLGPIQKLYAVKHNPFAYFKNIEVGANPALSLDRVKDFDGLGGLWADLRSGEAPNFSLIVPNQCHDMHGFVSGGPKYCFAGNDTTEPNLDNQNAALMQVGDAAVKKLITGIKASEAWEHGRNVIILVWDENDYSNAANRVIMTVETNYAPNGKTSSVAYDHYSLLRSLEAGFGLPCLNHACDATSKVMTDLFGWH